MSLFGNTAFNNTFLAGRIFKFSKNDEASNILCHAREQQAKARHSLKAGAVPWAVRRFTNAVKVGGSGF
jgi:hypothetical protein